MYYEPTVLKGTNELLGAAVMLALVRHPGRVIPPRGEHRRPGRGGLAVRGKWRLYPAEGLEVTVFEPGRALGLRGWGTFVLEPLGKSQSRLIVRGRIPAGLFAAGDALLLEVPHFVMERRMLLGIKERAERRAVTGSVIDPGESLASVVSPSWQPSSSWMTDEKDFRVLIVGDGVAALEAILAVADLGCGDLSVEVVCSVSAASMEGTRAASNSSSRWSWTT